MAARPARVDPRQRTFQALAYALRGLEERRSEHLPAHPKIPDPLQGPLQAFAHALRMRGRGKVSVAWIAGHDETEVSRAALYAALSGTRLPAAATVSTLLRWWAGDPASEGARLTRLYDDDPVLSWVDRLPLGHEGRDTMNAWTSRYNDLVDEVRAARTRPRAPRVSITAPPEQQRFVKELTALIEATELGEELWLLGTWHSRVDRYLDGKAIPTDDTCRELAKRLVSFTRDADQDSVTAVLERLRAAAQVARAARARDRRTARDNAAAPQATRSPLDA